MHPSTVTMKPKAYSYVRFSTPEQSRGDSSRRQAQLAQDYAARHDLDLDTSLTFKDLGVSAYRGRNAADGRLGDFLEAVRAGVVAQGSYLLVESLDRISRQTARKALRTLEDIVESGVTLVTLTDGKAYTKDSLDQDQMSLMWAMMVAIRAHEESSMKGRRMRAAWDAKRTKAAAEGKPMTAACPGWLALDKATGRFKLIAERAKVVRRVFRMVLAGSGVDKIAEVFNRETVPVFGSATRRAPRHWHRSYISRLIVNPSVTGVFIPHRYEYTGGKKTRTPMEPVPEYYPRVVDQKAWDGVQALLQVPNPKRGRHAKAALVNLLGGLARCPLCASSMILVNKGTKARRKLVCSRSKAGAGCEYRSVDYENVETALRSRINEVLSDAPAQSEEEARLNAAWEKNQTEMDLTTDHLNHLLEAIEQGLQSPALSERLRNTEAMLEELREQETALLTKFKAFDKTLLDHKRSRAAALAEAQPLDREAFNAALRALFRSVVIDYRDGELRFEWAAGGTSEIMYSWPETREIE